MENQRKIKKAGQKLQNDVKKLAADPKSEESVAPEQYAINKSFAGAKDTASQLIEGGKKIAKIIRDEKSPENPKSTPQWKTGRADPNAQPHHGSFQNSVPKVKEKDPQAVSDPVSEREIPDAPLKAPQKVVQKPPRPQAKSEQDDLIKTPEEIDRRADPAEGPVQQNAEGINKKAESFDFTQPPDQIKTLSLRKDTNPSDEIRTMPLMKEGGSDQKDPPRQPPIEDGEVPLSSVESPSPLSGSPYIKKERRPASFDEVYGAAEGNPKKRSLEEPTPTESRYSLRQRKTSNSAELRSFSAADHQPLQLNQSGKALQNQAPALKTAADGGQAAVKTAQAAQMGTAALSAGANAAGGAATGGVSTAIQTGKKAIDKIKDAMENISKSLKKDGKAILGKTGALLLSPFVLLFMVCGVKVAGFAINVGLSDEVNQLMPLIQQACVQWNIPEYAPLVAAVVMQESGGRAEAVGGDVMQCAESMGYPVGTPVPVEESISHGTHLLANYLAQAGSTGPADLSAISLALQSYNFGGGFMAWAQARGGYSKENAQLFAQQQAAAMGWSDYGDAEYVDHVLRYYQISGTAGDASMIAGGSFAYPLPGLSWTTYAGHEGIDIATPVGTPVYASASGTVSYAQTSWNPSMGYSGLASYGNCLFVSHGDGWENRYAHLSSVAVSSGSYVLQGQLIGYSGNTGNSTGPHLHLAIYLNGSPSSGGVIYAEQAWPQYKTE